MINIKTPGRGEDNEEALAFAAEVGGGGQA